MGYFGGFAVTLRQIGKRRLTRRYVKDEGGKREKAERFHGRHVLNRYEDGMEKCIGCELCAGVCPAKCIYVRGEDNPPDDPVSPGERYGFVYEINYLRCIHCDLCVEACPTEAITETKLFEFSFTNRDDAIYTKAELLVDDDGMPRQLPWEDWSDAAVIVDNTSAWVRATAPSGNAGYEGTVAWSAELGFGVRPAEVGQSGDQPAVASHDSSTVAGGDTPHGEPQAAASHDVAPTAPAIGRPADDLHEDTHTGPADVRISAGSEPIATGDDATGGSDAVGPGDTPWAPDEKVR